MPLDPQARAILDQVAAAGIQPNHTLSVADARLNLARRRALTAGVPEPVARVENRVIPGPAGDLNVRIYWPEGSGPFGIMIYCHGGGWVVGDLDTHDGIARALANAGDCIVVSVGYRLAPEHKFPAAAEDAYAATQWAAANAASLGGDAARLAVGGDSAGGNLAAAVTLMARDRGGPRLAHQLLFYPVIDHSYETASYRENGTGAYQLSQADMTWYWDHYLDDESAGRNPYASPLRAESLSGLPPALVVTAEYDPLRDEGEAYAARLKDAGVPVVATCYPGVIHGFFGMAAALDKGKQGLKQAGDTLRSAFGG